MDWRYVLLPLLAVAVVGFGASLVMQAWVLVGVFAILLVGLATLALVTSGALDR